MLKVFILLSIILFVNVFCVKNSFANYITVAANTSEFDESGDDCVFNSDGSVTSGGSSCILYFMVPVSNSYTLGSVTAYYYDNSGSQSVGGKIVKTSLFSDSYTESVTFSDTTTSSSIQSSTLSYGYALSSTYTYTIIISLNYGSELRGLKIYYY